jgi:4-amino-4-deoxy-L-arabinose transferase-like glycosyltransferase
LYCDCRCDHTPLYPYLAALMFRLSPDGGWLRAMFLTFPAALGDAAIALALFALVRRFGDEKLGFAAAVLYALNPISIYEIRLAHWDGLTTFVLLASVYALGSARLKTSGVLVGIGALLKQFPLALLPLAALKERNLRKAVTTSALAGVVLAAGFLPFLLACPAKLVQNLTSHPLWQGSAPSGVGVGTVQQVFEKLGVPQPRVVWLVGFLALLGFAALRSKRLTLFELTGVVLVVLAYFTYATHRQLVVWALPFMIVFSLERKTYIPLALAFAGYAIRLFKPAWYFGFVHLFAGAWFYAAMIGARWTPASASGLATREDATVRT